MWFEVFFGRSTTVNKIPGQVSAVFRAILDVFFNPVGHDFSRTGLLLGLPDGTFVQVFLKLSIVIADEVALHFMYMCKGATGLKTCLLCQNVFNANDVRGVVAADSSGWAVAHTCHDSEKFVPHTTATVIAIVRRLAAAKATLGKGAFKELEIRLGWKFAGGSLIESTRHLQIADPTEHAVYDWMHVFFVQGVFNIHMGLLATAAHDFSITYSTMEDYVSRWRWPVILESKIGMSNGPLSKKRAKTSWEAGIFKATASEGLSLLPVLAFFFERVGAATTSVDVKAHVDCFQQLCAVVNIIRSAARARVDPASLRAAAEGYLKAFQDLYGTDPMVPKFHCILHFHKFLERFNLLPNCFTLERKHKQPKRFANELRNTRGQWETSVARDVTSRHMSILQARPRQGMSELLDPVCAPSAALTATLVDAVGEGAFRTSRSARINEWERVGKGDVVVLNVNGFHVAGQIALLFDVAEPDGRTTFCQVECFDFVSPAGTHGAKYKRTGLHRMQFVRDIVCAVVWSGTGSIVTVLYPAHAPATHD